MKHIKLEPMIAPTMSAATTSQSHSLPSAHSSPYSLPTPIAKAQASPANHTGASRCSISSSQDVTTSDTHSKSAIPNDANADVVAHTNRCLVLSLISIPSTMMLFDVQHNKPFAYSLSHKGV